MTYKEHFIEFLKSKCLYGIFKLHIVNRDKSVFDDVLNMHPFDYSNWVADAFEWHQTSEGHEYWSGIDREWHGIYLRITRVRDSFVDFLKDNDILEVYKKNCGENNTSIPEVLDSTTPDMWISRGFIWMESPEGLGFWIDIENKWNKLYSQNMTHKVGSIFI